MIARKLWEKIETDYLMSWLSTLGGGYSALGEQFSNCVSQNCPVALYEGITNLEVFYVVLKVSIPRFLSICITLSTI